MLTGMVNIAVFAAFAMVRGHVARANAEFMGLGGMGCGPERGKSGKNGKGGNRIGTADGKEFAIFGMWRRCQANAEPCIARIATTSRPSTISVTASSHSMRHHA